MELFRIPVPYRFLPACMGPLLEALKANPAIIHFATHVDSAR